MNELMIPRDLCGKKATVTRKMKSVVRFFVEQKSMPIELTGNCLSARMILGEDPIPEFFLTTKIPEANQ